jgi:hypothetical protein
VPILCVMCYILRQNFHMHQWRSFSRAKVGNGPNYFKENPKYTLDYMAYILKISRRLSTVYLFSPLNSSGPSTISVKLRHWYAYHSENKGIWDHTHVHFEGTQQSTTLCKLNSMIIWSPFISSWINTRWEKVQDFAKQWE